MKHFFVVIAFALFGISVYAATLPLLPKDFPAKWEKTGSETCTPKKDLLLVTEYYEQKNPADGSMRIIILGKKNGIPLIQIQGILTEKGLTQNGYVLIGKHLYSFNSPKNWNDYKKFFAAMLDSYGLTEAEWSTCK